MKDQHKQIKGYRDFNQQELDWINRCKRLSVEVGKLVDEVSIFPDNDGTKIQEALEPVTIDRRWLNIGKTDLQTGFMALIRSIARPETF